MNHICENCRPCVPCLSCINKAKKELTHGCDGPITDFVIISRGCFLLEKSKFNATIVSNAIAEALQEWGFMSRNNEVYPTGS